MNQESLTQELANTIKETHYAACEAANNSRCQAEQALQYASQCGGYVAQVSTMTKGRMLGWLRDHVPDLTPERARAYLSLFHTQEQRQCHDLDKQQLLLLGVLDKKTVERQQSIIKKDDKWFVHVNKVRGWFSKTTRERPIREWSKDEAEVAINQLRPVVEIYNQLINLNQRVQTND